MGCMMSQSLLVISAPVLNSCRGRLKLSIVDLGDLSALVLVVLAAAVSVAVAAVTGDRMTSKTRIGLQNAQYLEETCGESLQL